MVDRGSEHKDLGGWSSMQRRHIEIVMNQVNKMVYEYTQKCWRVFLSSI